MRSGRGNPNQLKGRSAPVRLVKAEYVRTPAGDRRENSSGRCWWIDCLTTDGQRKWVWFPKSQVFEKSDGLYAPLACHGDVLAEIANSEDEVRP